MTPPVVQSVLPHLQTLPAGAATAYHERTKHGLSRYARGPETLDWDAQPDPFRRYARAPLEPLPLTADTVDLPWSQLFIPGAIPPRRFNRTSLGLLLELSFALAAWKQQGPDRWAVRCNPSSGNLHPTEAYVLSRGSTALDDALYHYAPREHALEMRCRLTSDLPTDAPDDQPRVYVGLSSIHSREAWKYGERAFRYCQLDVGHAIGALRYAAAVLGWRTRIAPVAGDALAHLLGLDRDADFGDAEREDPELLIELIADPARGSDPARVANPTSWTERAQWRGHANRLDHHPMYHWPVIDEVARATLPGSVSTLDQHAAAPPVHEPLANEFSAHEFAAHEPLAHPALPHAPLSIHVADRLDPGPR